MLWKIAAFVEGNFKPGLFTLIHLDKSCAIVCKCARQGRAGQGRAEESRPDSGAPPSSPSSFLELRRVLCPQIPQRPAQQVVQETHAVPLIFQPLAQHPRPENIASTCCRRLVVQEILYAFCLCQHCLKADLTAHCTIPILLKPYAWLQTELYAYIVLTFFGLMQHAVGPSWQERFLRTRAWTSQVGAVPAPPPALAWDSSY